jgi:hypothetical protein
MNRKSGKEQETYKKLYLEFCCLWIRNRDRRENGERVRNGFETRSWRGMLKIKWTNRIMNGEVFQRAKEVRLFLKFFKNRRHSWIGHTVRGKEFVVNILEGAISGKGAVGKPGLQYLKQVARNTAADSYTEMKRMACNNSRRKAANQSFEG